MGFNQFPYTNFHELNLDYFIQRFKEIFEEWHTLYETMEQWKTDTNADITSWEQGVIDDLEDWKEQFDIDFGHLIDEVTAQADRAVNASTSAQASATSASNSAQSATNSAGTAVTAKTEAQGYATQASNYRDSAQGYASDASTSASSASASATSASNSATEASGHATSAENSATNASSSATSANTAKNDAVTAKNTAVSASESATASATSASTSATNASNSATQASGYASSASASAISASNSADSASADATATSADRTAVSADRTWIENHLMGIKTTIDNPLIPYTSYFLGVQTAISLTFNSNPTTGDFITVVWYNGSTPSTFAITNANIMGFSYTPNANSRSELSCLFDGTNWNIVMNETPTT